VDDAAPDPPKQPAQHRLESRSEQVRAILEEHGVTAVSVFGSTPRGEDAGTSDLDLLVELRGATSTCRYWHPPAGGHDAEVVWWVVDDEVGSPMEEALETEVPRWLAGRWPFRAPRIVGRDITWEEWHAE
jgi:predicted nucleotidyltransferase